MCNSTVFNENFLRQNNLDLLWEQWEPESLLLRWAKGSHVVDDGPPGPANDKRGVSRQAGVDKVCDVLRHPHLWESKLLLTFEHFVWPVVFCLSWVCVCEWQQYGVRFHHVTLTYHYLHVHTLTHVQVHTQYMRGVHTCNDQRQVHNTKHCSSHMKQYNTQRIPNMHVSF